MSRVNAFIIKFMQNSKFVFFCCLVLGGALSAYFKFENFWDLANYHYYNPWAFLNNRLNYDIVPASVNTFFNPLLDLETYFLIEYFNDYPTLYYGLKGLSFGLLLFLLYKILRFYFDTNKISGCFYILLSMLIGATGQATYFQMGNSTNEMEISCFVLGAIYFLLDMLKDEKRQSNLRFFLVGGLLGIGLGLKPTIIIYCLALGVSLLFCFKYLVSPIRFVLFFAFGGFLGFLISNGYFMWQNWIEYGNPFMPFYAIFEWNLPFSLF